MLAEAKIFDDVGAVGLLSWRTFWRISRPAFPLRSLICRMEVRNARAGGNAPARAIALAEFHVVRLSGALDCREAGHQPSRRRFSAL